MSRLDVDSYGARLRLSFAAMRCPALHRGADSLGAAAQTLVCANKSMGWALYPAERWALSAGWVWARAKGNWWYLSMQWKGNLLVNLQIKAEVVDEEVDGNDPAVKQVAFH